jgi:hypothetical protein
MGDEEELLVAIWSGTPPSRSQAQLYAALAARFSEAAEALARSGIPFDVGDPALAERIRGVCIQMLAEDQRGAARPAGAGCDVGAVEYDPLAGLKERIYLPVAMR